MAEIQFTGVDEIIARFDKMANVDNVEKAVSNACAIVERDAKKKAPKKSGELRRSIQSRVESSGNEIRGVIFSPLEYAPYVEYGTGLFAEESGRKDVPWAYRDEKTGDLIFTSGQHPQPYLRPALHDNREEINRILKEGVSND